MEYKKQVLPKAISILAIKWQHTADGHRSETEKFRTLYSVNETSESSYDEGPLPRNLSQPGHSKRPWRRGHWWNLRYNEKYTVPVLHGATFHFSFLWQRYNALLLTVTEYMCAGMRCSVKGVQFEPRGWGYQCKCMCFINLLQMVVIWLDLECANVHVLIQVHTCKDKYLWTEIVAWNVHPDSWVPFQRHKHTPVSSLTAQIQIDRRAGIHTAGKSQLCWCSGPWVGGHDQWSLALVSEVGWEFVFHPLNALTQRAAVFEKRKIARLDEERGPERG